LTKSFLKRGILEKGMDFIRLLRPHQWYKNVLVFLAVIFSGSLFDVAAWVAAGVGFVALCALSSSTYVINDIADRRADRLNPEKAGRPIASGKVSVLFASVLSLISAGVGFAVVLLLPVSAVITAVLFFILCQLYTFWLKSEPFADVIVIAVNFVLRAVLGAFAINVWVSPWLVAGVFFLALFLILGKRRSEMVFLGKRAQLARASLRGYSQELIRSLSTVATACLVMSYTLFVFFGLHPGLYVTLPVALYAVFRYEKFIGEGSVIARHPHLVFKDARMLIAIVLWLALTLFVLYYF